MQFSLIKQSTFDIRHIQVLPFSLRSQYLIQRTMSAAVTLSSTSGASFHLCAWVCTSVKPRSVGRLRLESPVLGAPGLHLAQEMSASVLKAAGEDLTAGLRHQQGVFKLSWALAVSGHSCPAVRPRLVLPATWDITHTCPQSFGLHTIN